MIPLSTAILIAALILGIGLPVTIIGVFYFAYKMMMTAMVFRKAETVAEAAKIIDKLNGVEPPVPEQPAPAHDIEIGSLADNPKILETMRKYQDPSKSTRAY